MENNSSGCCSEFDLVIQNISLTENSSEFGNRLKDNDNKAKRTKVQVIINDRLLSNIRNQPV